MKSRIERAEGLMADLALHICEDGGQVWLEEFEQFMKKQICWIVDRTPKEERKQPILSNQYSVTITRPIRSFKEFLEGGTSGRHRCFFDANFSRWFGQCCDEKVALANLECKEIQEGMSDHDLVEALGGEAAAAVPLGVFLGALTTPIEGSPSVFGESDVLHVFYVRDCSNTIRAISVTCKKGLPQFIAAHSLFSNARWDKGRRVFIVKK
jgi:hypothetical protein